MEQQTDKIWPLINRNNIDLWIDERVAIAKTWLMLGLDQLLRTYEMVAISLYARDKRFEKCLDDITE